MILRRWLLLPTLLRAVVTRPGGLPFVAVI